MIKGWDKLTALYAGITALFLTELSMGNPNMFTFPVTVSFMMGTAYCALQWHVMKLFKRIEARHPDWK